MTDRDDQERRDLRKLMEQFERQKGDDEDRLTAEERHRLREFLRAVEKPEDRQKLMDLIPMVPDIKTIVEGKRVSAGVYRAVGEFAKWAGGVIALIVAYKSLIAGGK